MGASRRLFVRSDEEDEGSSDPDGDGAGPSTSLAARKSRKLSARQLASESHKTAGKFKNLRRLKRTSGKAAKDSDSDWEEEHSECEEIPETAWRQKWSQKKGDKEVRSNGNRISSKEPSFNARKRKKNLPSARSTSRSKAKFAWYDDRFNETTQKRTGDDHEILLGEEFEYLLVEEAMNASKETYTKEIDLPERFQMHEQSLTATESRDDWTKEAHWIHDRLCEDSLAIAQDEELRDIVDIDKEQVIKEIIFVLMQLHLEKCEVPVIGMYKFEECTHLAKRTETKAICFEGNSLQLKSFKALWMVFHWDRKWLSLLGRKNIQQDTWKSRTMTKVIGSASEDRTLDVLIQALQDADSEVAVDDLDAKFNLQSSIDEKEPPKGQYRRPKRYSFYGLCCKSAGLRQLVRQLGLTPEQLGENLHALQKIHEPLDLSVPPEKVDLSHASGQFTDLQSMFKGARHMAAYELSCEPTVRQFARTLFNEHAVVSTTPTSKGKVLIDAFHDFACVKHIQAKSVKSFNDGEWLLIQKAEEDELVEVLIELTQEVFDGVLMHSLQENYFSHSSSEVAELWNEQRKLILQEALSQMLLPLLAKEMRLSLTARAKAWVQAECCKSLWNRVSMAPYPIKDPFTDASTSPKACNDSDYAMVLACCWGSRNPPTTFVMLDASGEMVDTLQTGYLNVHPGSHEQQIQRKLDDQERLKRFILMHKPNVVVVGAVVNLACRYLKDTIAETVGKAAEVNSALTSVPVIYGDESLASLYEKSQVSLVQLPKQPSIIRRAVALGRSLQNPLALIATLCNPSRDIIALNMHPMQRFLSAEDLYTSIECVMVTVTNQVGVDVNLAVGHEWLFSPLQFVCGLGWKKASKIQQLIQEFGWLPSRESLFRYPFSLKDIVFRNCSGFLRIRRVGQAISGLRKLDPLDDTRIHPDHYEIARSLAIYAFTDGQASLDSEKDMDMVEQAIVHFQQNPDAIKEETVMSFFNSLQVAEVVNIEILKDIRLELLCGFSDHRAPYSQPTQDEEFSWLTGEDDTSLCIGKAVNAVVQKVFRHRAICRLESGIRGFLEKEDFTSDSTVDLTQVFSEGSSLTCYITNVSKDQFSVQLSCLGNNMEAHDHDTSVSHAKEVLYSEETTQNVGQSNSKASCFKSRDIHHPLFQNVSMSDVIKALSDESPGKVIFHPSSEGPACLCMTLKCQDNVYLQKEIEEFEKDSTDLATFSRLGKVLKIDGRNFSTLDEVVTSYAFPLISKMNEVLQSRQFQSGNDVEIRSFLNAEKQVSPDSWVHCFSMCPNKLGAIAVSYMVGDKVLSAIVDVYPEGYGLQDKMFRKMDTVVNYIKKIVNDAGCRWVGQDEEREKRRGDGTGRGRGGRFGSGRRGRGFQGRGGRGTSYTGKWGAQEAENGGWNSAGTRMNEHKKHEEQGFNNQAAEESNGWNEQKVGFDHLKSQGESGWGDTDGSLEKFNSGWGADDSKNAEKQDMTGWHVGKESGASEGNCGNAKEDRVEASKGQNDSGWDDTDVQLDKSQIGFEWGATDSKKDGWGAAGSWSGLQAEESHEKRVDGPGRGCGGRFGSGQRGRGFQARGGRGNSFSGKWGARETENSEWNPTDSDMNEHKKHVEQGDSNQAAEESNGWNEQITGFEVNKNLDESGWGITGSSSGKFEGGWGAYDSKNAEKQETTGEHVGEENRATEGNVGNAKGDGVEAPRGQNDSGWGNADVQLDKGHTEFGWGASDSRSPEKGGWGGAGCWRALQGEESHKQRGDGIGRGRGGRFGAEHIGRGIQGRGGRGKIFSGKWEAQEKENRKWNSAGSYMEHKKRDELGINDWAAEEPNGWSKQKVGFEVTQPQDESGCSGWEVDDSKNAKKQDLTGWHLGEENDTTDGGNAKFEASKGQNGRGWGDAGVQLDKGQTGFGWGANGSKNTEKGGWGAASSSWALQDDKRRCDKVGRGRGGRFGSEQRGRGFQGRGGRKWGAQETKNSQWNPAGSFMNEHKKHDKQGFNNSAAEESNGPHVSFKVSKGHDESGWGDADGLSEKFGSGWGADDSKNTVPTDWAAPGSNMKEKESKNDKQDLTGWHVDEENCGAQENGRKGNGAGIEVLKGQNDSGWDDAKVQWNKCQAGSGGGANDSKDTEKGGWAAAGSTWPGSHKQRTDGVGRGCGGRFGSERRGRDFRGRGGGGNSFLGKWGSQETESIDYNSAGLRRNEHKKHEEQGFNNWVADESNCWNKPKVGFQVPRNEGEGGWEIADGSSEKFESGWGADDSKNAEKQDMTGWHLGKENGVTEGNGGNAKKDGVEASNGQNDGGWGDTNVQLDKGETGFGWGASDSKNTEKGGWEAAGCGWAGQNEENHMQRGSGTGRGHGERFGSTEKSEVEGPTCLGQDEAGDQQRDEETGQLPGDSGKSGWGAAGPTCMGQHEEGNKQGGNETGQLPGERFESQQGGRYPEERENSSSGKEAGNSDWNSAGSLVNEHIMPEEKGFNNGNAEESHGLKEQTASLAVLKHKELNKENTETTRDGIWGACEDLINSNEIEGLIICKGSTNAPEPQHVNDALQAEETIESVLRSFENDSVSSYLAASMFGSAFSDKALESMEDHSTASESMQSGQENLEVLKGSC